MTLVEGNPSSSVRVVFCEDLQCGDCARLRGMMDSSLLPAYAARVAFEHRDFPLPKHSWARQAAVAARHFGEVDRVAEIEFRRQTLAKLKEISVETLPDHIAAFARAHGFDPAAATAANPTHAAAVEADYQDGLARGVAKTPTVFVGARAPFIETFSLEEVTGAIDQALAKSDRPVAIVTGASRGIGRGIAENLSATHHVVATYKGRLDAAQSLQAATGCAIFQCDVSSAADRAALIDFTRAGFGRLDLLVNNAGIAQRVRADILDADEESFDELIHTNLKGPHFLTQLAARWMLEQQHRPARIVFVTSISAYTASIQRAEYCVSKAGLAMSASLYAQRLAPEGVLVFEIRPGIIRTDMISVVEKQYEERIAGGLLPQRRMGEASDVAKAVRAIADGLLDYAAGQVLNVDGGFHMRGL